MSFVKITGEGSGEGAAEAAAEGLVQGVAQTAVQGVAQGVAGPGAKAAQQAAAVVGGAAQAGATIGAMTSGAGAGVGGVLGGVPGFAGVVSGGAVAGAAGGLVGAAAGNVTGAVGAVMAGAADNIAGAAGTAANIAGAVGGVAGNITGAAGGIAGAAMGAAGKVAGATMGGVAGAAAAGLKGAATGGIAGAVPGVLPDVELPFFEDKAITSTVGKVAGALGGLGGVVDAVVDAAGAALRKLAKPGSANLELEVASGDSLDVRNFSVYERISSLFQVNIIAVSDNPSIDFDAVTGKPARFLVHTGGQDRFWAGLCSHIEQIRVEPDGASTYQISIVPDLWLLTQRKNYRMFQQISEPDIVLKILKEWQIEPDPRIDRAAYKKRKYRVQYAESDFAFISRMLEDAGISYFFEQKGEQSLLVLSDAPHGNPPRGRPLTFVDDTSMLKKNDNQTVTAVRVGQRVRPGKVTFRDHDYRRPPSYKLMTTAAGGLPAEDKLERYHYTPGAFLFGTEQGEATPVADDRGKTRTDEKEGTILAQKRLDAKRGTARVCTFETNAHDVAPAMVITIANHPHEALGEGKKLLVVESSFNGTPNGEWSQHCEVRSADIPFRPELVTPRPKVSGVESATVVGPAGEEIHTDEFGRVRVHFHWDRESKMNQDSSCWIHVSQPWGGAGYGGINLPRIGQEVLVDFLGGDPDRPIIVGRVYTNLQKVPYKLPQDKTKSGWKSNSTGGGGGYNEIMFEDAKGRELINIQAEKDLTELVKHDAKHTVKNDRTTTVWNNNTQLVGKEHSLTIASSVTPDGPQAGPTKVTMVHERIELTTGKASIILDGPNIILRADSDITAAAVSNVGVSALTGNIGLNALVSQISMMGFGGVAVTTPSIVKIDGATAVLINCTEPKTETAAEEGPGFWGTVGAVALGVGVAAAVISAPVLAGVVIGGAVAYGMLSN